jgi:hypothetical protein
MGNLSGHVRADERLRVSLLYAAAGCLVAAQLLGVYALKSRKADLIFSLFMLALLVASAALAYVGVKQKFG